jgi:FkbM family methyltransferase
MKSLLKALLIRGCNAVSNQKVPERFFGQHEPPLDAIIYHRYFFHYRRTGVFVESGAADGVIESTCLAFERFLGWRGYNIEAMPLHFRNLQQHRPRATNIHSALSDKVGKANFTQAVHPTRGNNFGNGSLSHMQEHLAELDKLGCTYENYDVPTLTWDTFCESYGVNRIDLWVLDIEGHEPAVLNTLTLQSVLPLIAVVEARAGTRMEVTSYMEALHYSFDGDYEGNLFFRHPDFSFAGIGD